MTKKDTGHPPETGIFSTYIIYDNISEITIVIPLINFDNALPSGKMPLVLGLGVFDGVHRGHQKIISKLVEMADRCGALPAAVTFFPHPRQVLHPENPPPLLMPLEERCRLLRAAGAQRVGVITFDASFAEISAEDFLALLCREYPVAGICVGSRWRFGRNGAGDQKLIRRFAEEKEIEFFPCQEVLVNGEIASSSAIRRSTAAGYLDHARQMLGRPVRLYGKIAHGNQIAGSLLKAPTANMEVSCGVLPPDGVYSGRVKLNDILYPAAVNIGFSPTFQGRKRRVEAHVSGFSGSLYGEELTLELLHFIRPERGFESHEKLMAQIKMDVERVRNDFEQEKEIFA